MMGGRIFFAFFLCVFVAGCDDEPAEPELSEAEIEAQERERADQEVLESIRSGDIQAIAVYLEDYPDGAHVAEARQAISGKVPEQILAYRRQAARLGADPLLVLAAADVFEAYADQAPAALRFETVSNNASPPEDMAEPNTPASALRDALSAQRLAQYTSENEAYSGLSAATRRLFHAGDTIADQRILGDGPVFRIERGVAPADLMITADDGTPYQSLVANVRVEVHVPAHDGEPARVTYRNDAFAPANFSVDVTQVEGHTSANAGTRHRAVYDALLSAVGRRVTHGPAGRLAFYLRPQDYAAAVDLAIPEQSRALDAVVTKLEGTIPGVAVGTRCRLQVGRGNDSEDQHCRVGLVCSGQELYGSEISGFVPCAPPPVIVNDENPADGDPALRIDTTERKLTLHDAESGRFGEVSLEARLIAIDEPTPRRPAAPAEEDTAE